MLVRTLLIAIFCLAAWPTAADAWRLQDDSTFSFEASFEGTPLEGGFTDFDVSFEFDPQEPGVGTLRVSVALAGADMGDSDMNEAIAAEEWFDVKGFPSAQYSSDNIVETATGSYVAHGVLVLKGIRRDVDVPFTWSESAGGATMRGEFSLKRTDFDIGTGEWASGEQIGIDVTLRFNLQLEHAD
jgi:polyisoprenoid-binding protein YceI